MHKFQATYSEKKVENKRIAGKKMGEKKSKIGSSLVSIILKYIASRLAPNMPA